jgi:CBS domain containing-hemolysin-like protein
MSALLLAAVLVLILLSSLLNAAVSAVFAVGESRLRTLLGEGFHGAEALRRLHEQPEELEPGVRTLSRLLQIAAAALAAWAWSPLEGWRGLLVVLVATLTILLLAEVAPRAVASRWPIRMALSAAPLLLASERWLRVALFPILQLEQLLSVERGEEPSTPEEREVQEITELGREEGVVDAEEHQLIERAFRLDELTAWDIMVPRVEIFAWKNSLRLQEIVEELATVPYSRVPIYRETVDDVTGILYIREAYAAYVEGQRDTPLSQLAREPFFVPGSLSLAQLLRDFQTRRIHMGIVADEFGGTDGLVTLEDVLEELVGDIVDETDIVDEPLMRISTEVVEADGSVDLREINHAFNLSLQQVEHRSLNGFIVEELGYVPGRGESVERDGIQIDILEATDTQVLRARVRKLPRAQEEPA